MSKPLWRCHITALKLRSCVTKPRSTLQFQFLMDTFYEPIHHFLKTTHTFSKWHSHWYNRLTSRSKSNFALRQHSQAVKNAHYVIITKHFIKRSFFLWNCCFHGSLCYVAIQITLTVTHWQNNTTIQNKHVTMSHRW